MEHHEVLRLRGAGDEGEVLYRVEPQLHERRIGRVPGRIEHDGVAVGRRAHEEL